MTTPIDRTVQLTARGLQAALVEDLTELFKDDRFKTPEYLTAEELSQRADAATGTHAQQYRDALREDIHQHRMAAPLAYPQYLPLRETKSPTPPEDDEDLEPFPPPGDDDEETDPFPYILVRLDSGGIESQTDAHRIAVILLVGIFDDDPINQGHVAVMEILERIQRHYTETPVLGAFQVRDPIRWYLQDEASYPYFFGAMDLTFSAPAPRITAVEDLT